mgnify:CR=1 FL=1
MKKFVAILLTLMLVLGVSGALAADPNLPNATFKKNYTENGGTAPAATFTFKAEFKAFAEGATAEGPALSISNVVATGAGDYTATISPEGDFPSVGKYYYTVSEDQGNVAGVTYAAPLYLMVLVTNGEDGALVPSYYLYKDENKDTKEDTFTNAYSAGTLTVKKTVTGNLGDKKKEFDFTVTFAAPEGKNWTPAIGASEGATMVEDNPMSYTFKLKHDAMATFGNLPAGVTYTVTETPVDGYTTNNIEQKGTIVAGLNEVTFINEKSGTIDTGVTTENLPYVLLIGFVVLAGAALLIKRKAHNN